MVKVGQRVRFDPYSYVTGWGSESFRGKMVKGTVVMVNEPHKWFSVEFGEPKSRISFKFCDMGQVVSLIDRVR